MSTATLDRHIMGYTRTASASSQGREFSRARIFGVHQINQYVVGPPALEHQLTSALIRTTEVVRASIRDLGLQRAKVLIERIAELLDADEWDHTDSVLKIGSVRTLIRALVATNHDVGGITITRAGNLATAWSLGSGLMRMEALPDGRVSWAFVRRDGDKIDAQHQVGDTIANLRSICLTV